MKKNRFNTGEIVYADFMGEIISIEPDYFNKNEIVYTLKTNKGEIHKINESFIIEAPKPPKE